MTSVTYARIEASVLATLGTQPIWVIRTRMLLNTDRGVGEIKNFNSKVREIYAQDGIRGYCKGVSLSLFLSFSGVIQMYLYEASRGLYDYFHIP